MGRLFADSGAVCTGDIAELRPRVRLTSMASRLVTQSLLERARASHRTHGSSLSFEMDSAV
jgi:hypothetical protein